MGENMREPAESRFRLMTFNVRGCSHDDGANVWERRRELNVATIERAAPDLIGFQEIERENLITYQEAFPEYRFVLSPPQELHRPDGYSAIFWRANRFTMVRTDGIWLCRDPRAYRKEWGADCVRAAVWVQLRCRETGAELLHLTTHLDHISEQARVEGSRLILRTLKALEVEHLPILITGDFNCSPWIPDGAERERVHYTGESYRLFLAEGFQDSYLAAGNVDSARSNTFHGFQGEQYVPAQHHMGWRLDWILTRDGERRLVTERAEILRDGAPPLYPSDHYPVLADLLLTG